MPSHWRAKKISNNQNKSAPVWLRATLLRVFTRWNEYTVLIRTNKTPNFLFLGCVQSYIQYLMLMYQYSSSHQQELIQQPNLV